MDELNTGVATEVAPVEAAQEIVIEEPKQPEKTPQADIDAAISKRLAAQERKIKAEYEAKYKPIETALNTAMNHFGVKSPDEFLQTIERDTLADIKEAISADPEKAVELIAKYVKSQVPQNVPVVEAAETEDEPIVPVAQTYVDKAFERAIELGIKPEKITEIAQKYPAFKQSVESGNTLDDALKAAGLTLKNAPTAPPLKRAVNADVDVDFSAMSDADFDKFVKENQRKIFDGGGK